ncbi:MAG: DUF192 domain-containing protein [Candidatus Thermoplasmatota archaeon]|nr:DUF192 domain-containing protein [Candidatus Thermoplasmatota archaeon]
MAKKTLEHLSIKRAEGILTKTLGLMFKKNVDYGLLIPFRNESAKIKIHSHFVFFSFHAIFLDSEKRIVDVKKNISPFSGQISPDKPARYVLEVPADKIDIDETDLSIGRKLEL